VAASANCAVPMPSSPWIATVKSKSLLVFIFPSM
jgi:hypothetical protein